MAVITKIDPFLKSLNIRGNIYNRFRPDQVLTHNNLNAILDYFEDQDRWTRTSLIGVGIGCGLDFQVKNTSNGLIIEITQGVAVTTDGDIIEINTSEFSLFTRFNDRADISLFSDSVVYEIHKQEAAERLLDEQPLSSFSDLKEEYVLVAYVEDYKEEQGICDTDNCDAAGDKVYSDLHFLLVHLDDINNFVQNDTIWKQHNIWRSYDVLPEIAVPKILLNENNVSTKTLLEQAYLNTVLDHVLVQNLQVGVVQIINMLSPRLNLAKYGVNTNAIGSLLNNIFSSAALNNKRDYQYRYDLLQDLVETYNEVKSLLLHTVFECVPNKNAFPKHILLGEVGVANQQKVYRHQFYPAPMQTGHDENLLRIKALLIRFYHQLQQYNVNTDKSVAIKITPSKEYSYPLGQRAIPYYYRTKGNLVNFWDYDKGVNRKATSHWAYHTNGVINLPQYQEPLKYQHRGSDFYRIEGHLGKDFSTALRDVQRMRNNHNLAFDVKVISIGNQFNNINLSDYQCEFRDLNILLTSWRNEFNCLVKGASQFFANYSLKEDAIGTNQIKPNFEIVDDYISFVEHIDLSNLGIGLATTFAEGNKSTKKANKKATNKFTDSFSKVKRGVTNKEAATTNFSADNPTLGTILQESITDENVSCGASVAKDSILLLNAHYPDLVKDDNYLLYVEQPLYLMGNLLTLGVDFSHLNLFDKVYNSQLNKFKRSLNAFCKQVEDIKFKLAKAKTDKKFAIKQHDQMYEFFVYELSKLCCYKDKMNWLNKEIEKRKKDLFVGLTLAELVQKHPGIEHLAGVPKGGTFIMVYTGNVNKESGAERIANRKIVADFCLPYMCVSDCTPKTIVYQVAQEEDPQEEVDLKLKYTSICLNRDADIAVQQFEIQPQGAEITFPDPTSVDFIEKRDGGYFFLADKVPQELWGKPIEFEVNGKDVELTATVCHLPVVNGDIIVEDKKWHEDGHRFTFRVKLPAELNDKKYTYKWELGQQINSQTATDDLSREFEVKDLKGSYKDVLSIFIYPPGACDNCFTKLTLDIDESISQCDIPLSIRLGKGSDDNLAKMVAQIHEATTHDDLRDYLTKLRKYYLALIVEPALDEKPQNTAFIIEKYKELSEIRQLLFKQFLLDTQYKEIYDDLKALYAYLIAFMAELVICNEDGELQKIVNEELDVLAKEQKILQNANKMKPDDLLVKGDLLEILNHGVFNANINRLTMKSHGDFGFANRFKKKKE